MKNIMKNCFLIILALGLTLSCQNKERNNSEKIGSSAIMVRTTNVELRKMGGAMTFVGVFKPYKEANLGTSIPGRVEKIFFDEGAYVKQGDLLVKLSAELLLQTEIEFSTLSKDFERVERLRKQNSIAEQEYDHVKAKYDASKAKYDLMKSNTEIRAPFSGVIAKHLVQEGESFVFSINLDPGYSLSSGIVRLIQTDRLIVEVPMNEKDIAKAAVGMKAEVEIPAFPGERMEAKVKAIATDLSTLTKTGNVEFEMKNIGQKIKPGMSCKVFFQLPERECMAVPVESLINSDDGSSQKVFVIKNGLAQLKDVKVEFLQDQWAAVTGLQIGDQVVVSGKSKLSPGVKVEIAK